jgi:hypothetical protein
MHRYIIGLLALVLVQPVLVQATSPQATSGQAGAGQSSVKPAKVVSALTDCRGKADPTERLACYDQAVDALNAATSARDVVIIDQAEVAQTRKGLFGFALPSIPFLKGRADNKDDEADERRLVTTITEARSLTGDHWRFTVTEGAVWETTQVSRGFDDPKPGATVTIERGTFGAYYAVVGKRGRAAVRRIR